MHVFVCGRLLGVGPPLGGAREPVCRTGLLPQMAQRGAHLQGETWGYRNPYHGPPDNKRERLRVRGLGHVPSVCVCVCVCVCAVGGDAKCASCMVVSGLC